MRRIPRTAIVMAPALLLAWAHTRTEQRQAATLATCETLLEEPAGAGLPVT